QHRIGRRADRGQRLVQRNGDVHLGRLARRQLERVRERGGCGLERVGHLRTPRYRALAQRTHDAALVERRGAERGRRRDRDDAAPAVHLHGFAIPRDRPHARGAAHEVQELPRRVDLERAQRQEQRGGGRVGGGVLHAVARVQRGRARLAGGERGDGQRQRAGGAAYAGDRQVAALECVL